jgi:polyhydroxyalkanoate synthesis regulator protein
MMSNYIEQSKVLFVQMQEQMQSQTKNMFGNFNFTAGDNNTGPDKPKN